MEKRTYQKGEIIFQQNTFGTEFFEVESGEVGIYLKHGESDQKLLTKLGAGRCFGEMGVVESRPRTATAIAEDTCVLTVVTAESFADYVRENPQKGIEIMTGLSIRLRELTADYTEACRTIAEIERTEGKEKSGWLKTNLKKFARLYEEGLSAAYEAQSVMPSIAHYYPLPF